MKTLFLSLLICVPAFAQNTILSPVAALRADKSSYLAGESAIARLSFNTIPENEAYEFDASVALDSTAINLERPTEYEMYGISAALTAGEHELSAEVFIQDKNLAKSLKETVAYYAQKIIEVDDALAHTTNPTEIAQLQADRARYVSLQAAAQSELANIRTSIQSITLPIFVN